MVSRLPYLNINSMKRKITLLLISILTVSVCFAQSDDDRWKKKYINLGFINTTMSQDGLPDLKSNYGVSFTVGRTFYLHRPIGGFLRFGIDATWFDLNYTNKNRKAEQICSAFLAFKALLNSYITPSSKLCLR